MAKRKKKKPNRAGKRLSIDLDPQVRSVLDAYIRDRLAREDLKLTITQVVEMSLIGHFRQSGHWPPKSST